MRLFDLDWTLSSSINSSLETVSTTSKNWFMELIGILNSMILVDFIRVLLVAIGVWAFFKVGKKILKVILLLALAFVVVSRVF